jgi:hypothetical protein
MIATGASLDVAVVARIASNSRGVLVQHLLDLTGGDEVQLSTLLWRLAVAGDLHFTYATIEMPETAYAGPCHAVPQRFAATCPWCKDRLAQQSSADRRPA